MPNHWQSNILDEQYKLDVACIVGKLNSYTQHPYKDHLTAIDRLVKYLRDTIDSRFNYTVLHLCQNSTIRVQFQDKMKLNPLVVIYLPLMEELCLENYLNECV